MEKNNFLEPKNHGNLNISKLIYLKKIARGSVGLIGTYKLEGFFFFENIFFQGLGAFFYDCKTTNLGLIFFHKN